MSAASPSNKPTTSESTKATGIKPERLIVRALIGILIVVMVINSLHTADCCWRNVN